MSSSSNSSIDENERRFLRRATMLSRPSIPAREESPPSPFHPFLERSEKISVPSNPQERKITPTKSNNNNTSPSKPSPSTKRAREQEQHEKEAASEPSSDKNKKNARSRRRKEKDFSNEKITGSEEKMKEKQMAGSEEKTKEKAGSEEKRKEIADSEEKKKMADSEENRKEMAGSEEKRKKMADSEEKRKEKAGSEKKIKKEADSEKKIKEEAGSEEKKELADSEENRKEMAGSEEKMKEMASSEKKAEEMVDSEKKGDCNPKDEIARVPVACFEGGTSDGEIIKQFVQASTNAANKIKNEIIDEMGAENQKKFNQLKEDIRNKVREAKHGSSNNRACDDFRFSSHEMIERVSSFKSKELPPLSSSEMEEFEHKWREQEAIELEATIKRISLMQEELHLRMSKIRAPVNDISS